MPALRVGVLFISHQAPGCHNVVSGVFDYLQSLEPKGECVGILGGWKGLMSKWIRPITRETVDLYKNLGGQELLCHFGDSPSTREDLELCVQSLKELELDGLVCVGNLLSHLDSAFLAEMCIAV